MQSFIAIFYMWLLLFTWFRQFSVWHLWTLISKLKPHLNSASFHYFSILDLIRQFLFNSFFFQILRQDRLPEHWKTLCHLQFRFPFHDFSFRLPIPVIWWQCISFSSSGIPLSRTISFVIRFRICRWSNPLNRFGLIPSRYASNAFSETIRYGLSSHSFTESDVLCFSKLLKIACGILVQVYHRIPHNPGQCCTSQSTTTTQLCTNIQYIKPIKLHILFYVLPSK